MKLSEIKDLNLLSDIKLSELQEEAVRWFHTHPQALLVASTGAGKTLTVLTAATHILRLYPNFRLVVCCPAEANKAFAKECKRLGLPCRVNEATGITGAQPSDARVFLFNFSSMGKYLAEIEDLSKKYSLIGVVDEAHVLQRNTSKQFENLKHFRQFFKIIWMMTATPLMSINHMKGLYNVIDYLSPGGLKSWTKFRDEHLRYDFETFQVRGKVIKQERILGVRNAQELRKTLSQWMLVKLRDYNIKYHYHSSPLDPSEWKYYRQAGRGIIENFEKEGFASRLHDLQRVVDWSHETLPEELQKKLSSKEKLLLKVLKDLLSKDLSALVYTEYIDTADRLKHILGLCQKQGVLPIEQILSITGDDSKKARNAVEDKIKPRTLVICTQAGSQSRNLQKASQIVIYNVSFSIGRFLQLIGRVARMDSEFDQQDIHIVEAEGTIDTYKRILIQDNAHLYASLFGENSNLPDISKIDRAFVKNIRKELLWSFSGFGGSNYAPTSTAQAATKQVVNEKKED